MTNQQAAENLRARGIKPWKLPAHEWEALMAAEMGLTPEADAAFEAARETAADARLAKGEADLRAARVASAKP